MVKELQAHFDKEFEDTYEKIVKNGVMDKFCSDMESNSKGHFRSLYNDSWQSVLTRIVQYEYRLKYGTYLPVIEFSNFTPEKFCHF